MSTAGWVSQWVRVIDFVHPYDVNGQGAEVGSHVCAWRCGYQGQPYLWGAVSYAWMHVLWGIQMRKGNRVNSSRYIDTGRENKDQFLVSPAIILSTFFILSFEVEAAWRQPLREPSASHNVKAIYLTIENIPKMEAEYSSSVFQYNFTIEFKK